MAKAIRIGTAGWSIPAAAADHFPSAGSGLTRYASVLSAVEINSTFKRSHRPSTFARWAASTPDDFRFAVKIPHEVSHERRLVDVDEAMSAFAAGIRHLGPKLGSVLLQLPPSLLYDRATTEAFCALADTLLPGKLVCEPRHPTWFVAEVDDVLRHYGVARVAADPAKVSRAAAPGGAAHRAYFRLHGSPRMYYSAYTEAFIEMLVEDIKEIDADEVWCIFDNTAAGAAVGNALALTRDLDRC